MALILPRKALSAYDKRLAELEGKAYEYASSRISAFIEKFPGAKPEQVREFAIEVVDDAVGAFGDGASSLAADMYEGMAELSGVRVKPAVIDTSDVHGHIESEVRYQLGKFLSGDPTGFVLACGSKASDQVARRANQTMRLNAKRDGLRYARVPMGGETCSFCAMLASRGFDFKTAKSAGDGNHYHKGCRCKVIPGFPDIKVEGYDPDEWLDRWRMFEEIDESTDEAGRPLSTFDRHVLKLSYVMDEIDFDKVETGVRGHFIPPAKLEKYALSPSGDENKARAFRGYLGYTQEDAATVASLVYEYVADHPPSFRDSTPHGDRYTTEMVMRGKDGKNAKVKVGWMKDTDTGKMRLTTIFVDE